MCSSEKKRVGARLVFVLGVAFGCSFAGSAGGQVTTGLPRAVVPNAQGVAAPDVEAPGSATGGVKVGRGPGVVTKVGG